MELDAMKYPQLRSLAKQLGLKANMKADKLLKTIKQHYEQEQKDEQVNGNEAVVEQESGAAGDPSPRKSLFVTSRRGKKTKRKISDVDAVADEQTLATAEEAETEAVAEGGRTKRARVSATTEPEPTGPETQPQAPVQPDPAACDPGNKPKVGRAGKIPRYEGLVKKNKALKPVTPNFKKLHEAHFKRMESIDSYVQRMTKPSAQDPKLPSERTLPKPADGKQQQLVKRSRASLMSPAPVAQPAAALEKPRASRAVQREAAFRPSVLSTRRINVRFSEATHDNEPKKSLLKTPARLTLCVAQSTPGRPSSGRRSNVSATKTTGAFVFTGNTSFSTTPRTNKPNFNLKASLSKPLSYKPHTGKLKPFGETKENAAVNSSVVQAHQKNYKQHQVQTREERRTKQTQDRKQKKESALGARRGLVMS